MAFHERLDDALAAWVGEQHVFFTGTAPREGGRVNVSPKGVDGLVVLDHETVAYLDHTGSGHETAAHIKDDGRLTIMLCAFEGAARILRLYGTGRSVYPGDAGWNDLAARFPPRASPRQIVVLSIESVQTSCGFGVPRYAFEGQRETLTRWAEEKGPEAVAVYQHEHNVTSIDGLPTGLPG